MAIDFWHEPLPLLGFLQYQSFLAIEPLPQNQTRCLPTLRLLQNILQKTSARPIHSFHSRHHRASPLIRLSIARPFLGCWVSILSQYAQISTFKTHVPQIRHRFIFGSSTLLALLHHANLQVLNCLVCIGQSSKNLIQFHFGENQLCR